MEQGGILVVAIIEIAFQEQEPSEFTAVAEFFEVAFDFLRAGLQQNVELARPDRFDLASQMGDPSMRSLLMCVRLAFDASHPFGITYFRGNTFLEGRVIALLPATIEGVAIKGWSHDELLDIVALR